MRTSTSLAPWGILASMISVFAFGLLAVMVTELNNTRGMALMTGIVLVLNVPALLVTLEDRLMIQPLSLAFSIVVVGLLVGIGWITFQIFASLVGEMEVIYRSPVTAFFVALNMAALWISAGINVRIVGLPGRGPLLGTIWLLTPVSFVTTGLLALRFLV